MRNMRKVGKSICLLAVLALLAGCGKQGAADAESGVVIEPESAASNTVADAALESESGAAGEVAASEGSIAVEGELAAASAESAFPESGFTEGIPEKDSSGMESSGMEGSGMESSEPKRTELESTEPASAQKKPESAEAAYAAFLEGDISLFDDTQVYTYALDAWKDTILALGELECTYLDLDGDGAEELLVQWIDAPGGFNGVFHYDKGSLFCWQFDCVEMSSRDYPLKDGTMVSQYDYNGTSSYTIFRYRSDGSREEIGNLFAREELVYPGDTNPCPYYEVDGEEVDKVTFDERLRQMILDQMPERNVWTEL